MDVPTTALIIGGSGGVGSALCEHLLEQGSRIVAVCRHPERLSQLAERHPALKVVIGDATNEADVRTFVEKAHAELGRVEAAAYCVGSMLLKPAHLTTAEEFTRTLELNLVGAFLLLKTLAPLMTDQGGGSILFFSSAAAALGLPNHEAIAAAKAGLEGLTRSAAMTYARHQVRVNSIAPGLLDTPLSSFLVANQASLTASIGYHPLGRIGRPKDLIEAAAWCLGPSSSWMTGAILPIDGGMRAGRL